MYFRISLAASHSVFPEFSGMITTILDFLEHAGNDSNKNIKM
jgi:hypothetical protein